jgi:PmbA protein
VTLDLTDLAQRAVARALAKGATETDAFIREDETFSVNIHKSEVEKLKEAVSRSLRLRVFVGKKTATSQTSDLSTEMLERLVDETVEMAKLTSDDDSGGLPDKNFLARDVPDLRLLDSTWDSLAPEVRIDLARRVEAAAYKTDSRITNSRSAWFEWERSRTVLANSLGFYGSYESAAASLGVAPVAESNGALNHDHWYSVVRRRDLLGSPEEIGRLAAERAVRRLDARKVKTCEIPVVFEPRAARTLVGHLFDAVSGDAIYRGRSFLVDQIGQSIAAPSVHIVDDARMPEGLGSCPFDDEGVATQTTSVVEGGVLRNYLHSAYTARKLQAQPTGNGSRAATGAVAVGPTNFHLKPGPYAPEEILASIPKGLLVVDLLGSGVNPVTGDYSRGASGLWIENGKVTYPVHEVTIAGNLKQMFRDIEMIGRDIQFDGSVAAPTLKIRQMTLSGD